MSLPVIPRPFANNLRKGDRVYDTLSERQGKVERTPQNEKQRKTPITLDGTSSVRYLDVMQLRFINPQTKQPEDEAPVDGVPPEEPEKSVPAPPKPLGDVLTVAQSQRQSNQAQMDEMTARFKALKSENERLDQVIALLSA